MVTEGQGRAKRHRAALVISIVGIVLVALQTAVLLVLDPQTRLTADLQILYSIGNVWPLSAAIAGIAAVLGIACTVFVAVLPVRNAAADGRATVIRCLFLMTAICQWCLLAMTILSFRGLALEDLALPLRAEGPNYLVVVMIVGAAATLLAFWLVLRAKSLRRAEGVAKV